MAPTKLVHRLARSVAVLAALTALLIVVVWWTSAHGRSEVVKSQRQDCVQRSRSAAIGAEKSAGDARAWAAHAAHDQNEGLARADLIAAQSAASYAQRLGARSDESRCIHDFPDPGVFAFR